jgi:glycosyltransferase involved in cell wall biosynthesis
LTLSAAEARHVAARMIATLRPQCVHTSDLALAEALAARNIALGEHDADLAVWTEPGAVPHAARRVLATAPAAGLRDWLDHVAALGLCPMPAYDASYLAPTAVLLETVQGLQAGAVLDACAALIEARASLRERELALNQATTALDQRLERHAQAQRHAVRLNLGLQDKLMITEARLAIALHEREIITNSTIWRATGPLRRMLDRLPRRRARPGDSGLAPQGLGPTAYERWVARYDTLDDADRAAINTHIEQLVAPPVISVIMPAYNTEETLLRAAIASVQAQLYPHWQLCIADDASPSPHVARVLAELAEQDIRIRWVRCAVNGNISAATNAALTLAQGPFVALMDHDDLLPEHALYQIAAELEAHPDADLIYSDEDQIDADGRRTLPYFKPDWNIDLMLAHNMVSHLGVYRRSLVEQVGGARLGYEGSQDYDLALRVADATTPDRIRHIPAVLYHWRQHTTSFSKARIDACVSAARQSIADHLDRTGQTETAIVRPAPSIPTWTRVQYRLPKTPPRVTVIVPTRDKPELLAHCVDGLLTRTDYPDVELIIADNDSQQAETLALFGKLQRDPRVRVLACPGTFNYSAMNNTAAALASGAVLALINNDIDVIEPSWLSEMVSQALRPDVGAVGARLLFPDGTVQHAGVVLGVGTFDGGPGVAGHYSLADAGSSFGYFGASALVHEVAAVTAACMVLRKSTWDAAGGLDDVDLPVAFNDVDLCLRLRGRGLRNIWTPYAALTHRESASRGDDLAPQHRARFDHECRIMRDRWGPVLDADPFYNPNFSRLDGMFRLLGPSLRRKPWQ